MQITSVGEIIEELGGYRRVSQMCGSTPHAALMWRARGSLPRRTFIVLTHALAMKGHSAPPRLWRMDSLPARRSNGKARK